MGERQTKMDLKAIVAGLPNETQVCRCVEIQAITVHQAIEEGANTINEVKRRTRAGMGVCQGVFCARTIAAMINDSAGVPLESLVPMTARPPARLIPLAQLAASEE